MAEYAEARALAEKLVAEPSLFWDPSLCFLRDALTKLGCTLPPKPAPAPAASPAAPPPAAAAAPAAAPAATPAAAPAEGDHPTGTKRRREEEADAESESAEEPLPPFPETVSEGAELWDKDDVDGLYAAVEARESQSEEDRDAAAEARSAGMQLMGGGDLEKALEKFTDGLRRHSGLAPLWAARAQCYLRMKRPLCAARDCDAALAINPDQAKALRVRGQAMHRIGEWEKAAADLHRANSIDFDGELRDTLKDIEKRAGVIREWRNAVGRVEREREAKRRRKGLLKRQAELRKQRAREEEEEAEEQRRREQELPPVLRAAMADPEVRTAMEALMRGDQAAANAVLQKNPKVLAVLESLGIVKVQRHGAPPGAPGPKAPAAPAAKQPPARPAGGPPVPTFDDLD